MTAKTDTPKAILKKTTPPPREKDEGLSLFERCFHSALQGLTAQAEMALHPDVGSGDFYCDDDKTYDERNRYLVERAVDIAGLAEAALREELSLRRFNHEV